MRNSKMDWDALGDTIKQLPVGAPRMAALLDAIRQADEAKLANWSLLFRYRYICEAVFHDDSPKGMPVAAEFATIFEAHPDALSEYLYNGVGMYLMAMNIALSPIVDLPQIPMEQWETLMAHFYTLVQRYQMGLRVYWWQMCRFWQYIDKEKAFSYFQKFWNTARDDLSDCPACEHSYAVYISLLMGDRAAADAYAAPMEAGRMEFCEDTPQRYWLAYLEDALNRGDLQEAGPIANRLYHKANRDRSDLNYIGAVLRCWAFTEPGRAVALVEQRLEWTMGLWNQNDVYCFYKGAWVCFRELAKRMETVRLALPTQFPLYCKGGTYRAQTLADWFYTQAAAIGQRFDQRNHSDYFTKDLALADA